MGPGGQHPTFNSSPMRPPKFWCLGGPWKRFFGAAPPTTNPARRPCFLPSITTVSCYFSLHGMCWFLINCGLKPAILSIYSLSKSSFVRMAFRATLLNWYWRWRKLTNLCLRIVSHYTRHVKYLFTYLLTCMRSSPYPGFLSFCSFRSIMLLYFWCLFKSAVVNIKIRDFIRGMHWLLLK